MDKKILLLFCLLFVAGISYSNAQKLLKKADLHIQNHEYDKAAQQYLQYLKKNKNDYEAMNLLAASLAKSGDLSNADIWYNKIITENQAVQHEIILQHGLVLKKMGYYKDALTRFHELKKFNYAEGTFYTQGCDFALNEVSKTADYELTSLPVNSSASDYGLTFYKKMPVFTSFREDILLTETEKELQGDASGQKTFIYNSTKNRLLFVKGPDSKINHIGPVSFSEDGKKCAIIEAKSADENNFILYPKVSRLLIADVNDNGEIESYKPFTHNEVGSTINSAFIAYEGTALYFSSDRTGGFGGYDLYVSYYKNNEWTMPENLGSNINSPGNEVTPCLKDGGLFFSSDYHMGLGGFDIFVSQVNEGVWSNPENKGFGINSSADEFFPVFNSLDEFFITSNRLGGKGNFDIYKAFKLTPEKQIEQMASTTPPPAVNLEELAVQTQSPPNENKSATQADAKKAFFLPEFDVNKIGSNATATEVSFAGAYRVALQETIPNTEVFFIQLASVSSLKPDYSKFKPLLKYGNIYKMANNKILKVRLGYFSERREAEDILVKVKQNGYKDAFISFELLNTAQMELVLTGTDESSFTDKGNFNTKNPEVEKSYISPSKYKVRLASYEDPIWFDINKVKDLGRIEQWTKGGWTIFILAGFNNLEEAKKAQISALNRGYKTAEVVIDNGGILERLKQN